VKGITGTQTSTFSGQTVDATAVLVKFTYAGDANLDGAVDIGDLGLLAGSWQLSSKVWTDGDFTYNGTVDIGDLGLLAGNWQKGTVGNPNPQLDFATAVASTLISLVLGVPAAYGIIKGNWRAPALFVLIARMTPALSYLIPWFILFRFLELNNTLLALVIAHLVIGLPLTVWVMMGFFEGLPGELEEAALVDGATIWQAFRHVAMPLARPGITVATILAFIFSWNNFVFGAVLAGRATRTLPAAVYNVLTFEQLAWGPLAAAAIVVTVPVLLLTIFIQKEIVAGLTAGGVKA